MQNTQISDFGTILLFIIGAIMFTVLALTFSWFIRPKRPNFEKLTTYECGEDAIGNAWGQFNARFYVIALIFLLFEVEILFVFPWATVFGNEEKIKGTNGLWGWFSLVEMFLFIGLLILGLAYAWVKGYLDWIVPQVQSHDYKSPVPKSMYEEVNQKYESTGKGR